MLEIKDYGESPRRHWIGPLGKWRCDNKEVGTWQPQWDCIRYCVVLRLPVGVLCPSNIQCHITMVTNLWLCISGDFIVLIDWKTRPLTLCNCHYPDTEPTNPCLVLIMMWGRLGNVLVLVGIRTPYLLVGSLLSIDSYITSGPITMKAFQMLISTSLIISDVRD